MRDDEKSEKMEYASECQKKSNLLLLDVDGDGVPDYVQVRLRWLIASVVSIAGTVMTYVMT